MASTHLYHATSMIRFLLGVKADPVRISARSFVLPLVDPMTSEGPTADLSRSLAPPAPYPLAPACQDHLLGLAIERSARTGADVVTDREPWADHVGSSHPALH